MEEKSNTKNLWDKIFSYAIDIALIIILIYYLLSFSIYQCENPAFKITFISLLCIMIFYFTFYKILIKIKNYKIFIFLVSFLLYGIWGIFSKTIPVSDYEVLIKGAQAVINRNI